MPGQALAVFVGGLLCGLVLRSNDDDGAPRRRRLVGGERSDELQRINTRLDALTLGLEALLETGARRPLVDGAGALAGRASLAALMDAYVGEHDGERSLVLEDSGAIASRPTAASDDQLFRFHAAHGYTLARGLVPPEKVAAMNAAVEAARAARRPLKRINEKREANADDNVYYSPIKDLHAFQGSREEAGLAAAARDVLLGDEVATLLEKITGHASQLLYRSAYFEYSRTTAHQDYYYFDSVPSGELRGVWVALEDTAPGGDRFFLVPGLFNVTDAFPTRSLELNAVNAYLDAKVAGPWAGAVFAPDLKAGDALVWNSWLVHGSLAGDVRTTRKSLIGHFTPAHLDIRSFVDPAMTMASLPKGDDRGRAYYDTEAAGRGPHFDQPVVHTRHHRGAAGGGRPEAAVR